MAKVKKDNELPLFLFHQGTNSKAYEFMGAHWTGKDSAVFRVWAPHALEVSVIGDFNCWDAEADPMKMLSDQGVWEGPVQGVQEYDSYKFHIQAKDGTLLDKSDPYAFHSETRPGNASKLCHLDGYQWQDGKWMGKRDKTNWLNQPINIYEMHLSSWRTYPDGNPFNYRKLAEELVPYVYDMGYTHVELMPVTEYPFDGSWGYQVTGYFAPTSRFGTPEDLMFLIDAFHQAGIGVLMDWVPAHFPKDANGLYKFDGDFCYEYELACKREHYEWGTHAFDYGRSEVVSFLTSSAMYWIEQFHMDGIRVDAVASMLYLDYGRQDGEWLPNINGGKENLEAVALLRRLNKAILTVHPGVLMVAEESTSWPLVTKPDYNDGLGFTLKWNMGWMNDALTYASMDPYFRSYNHDKLTFAMFYAFSENFILPVSHDEVVHGKCSLINKMPGEVNQKFAGLRAFLGYMMSFPGKKLTFMGTEFGQFSEWNFQKQLDWALLEFDTHRQTKDYVYAINHFYREHSALWQIESSWEGYRWLNADDNTRNVISYLRTNEQGDQVAVICNFSPVRWDNYTVGMPEPCTSLKLEMNSEWKEFGGATEHEEIVYRTKKGECGDFKRVFTLDLEPLSVIYLEVRNKKPEVIKQRPKVKAASAKKAEAPAKQADTPAKKTEAPAKKAKAADNKPISEKKPASKRSGISTKTKKTEPKT